MTFPTYPRTVEIRRGKGRYSCPIGRVVLDLNDPDCLKWNVMAQNGLSALVVESAGQTIYKERE